MVEGLLAFAIARAAGVPGPPRSAVWVALWSLLPVAGVFIGALPIVVFAGATSTTRAVVVALAFVVIGIGDWFVSTAGSSGAASTSARSSIVLAAFGGLELYGLTGALLLLLGAIIGVAIVAEIGPEEVGRSAGRAARRRRPSRVASAAGQSTPRMTVLADENQPPVPFTHASSRVLDLAAVRLAAELARRFDEQEHAAHAGVAVRQPAAVGVGRAARRRRAACRPRRTGRLRPSCRIRAPSSDEQHHRRERVVDLAHVDVVGRHAGAFERELCRCARRATR